MLLDYVSGGSQVNPSISIATYFYGWNTFPVMLTRIFAQIASSFLVFPVLEAVTPKYVELGGPELSKEVTPLYGALHEIFFTFLLMGLVIFFVKQFGLPSQRAFIAAAIRGLIYYGGATGPSLNPMIAFAWAWYTDQWANPDHFLVFWIAPTIGATLAVLYAKFLEGAFTSSSPKEKTS